MDDHGVRITCIDKGLRREDITEYLRDGGLSVKKIYYPLNNNDAVVYFTDARSKRRALFEKTKFNIYPLTHNVYSKVTVELDPSVSSLFALVKEKIQRLTDHQLHIAEKSDGSFTLSGDRFNIELAENLLSQEVDRQFSIEDHINGHDTAAATDYENTKTVPRKTNVDKENESAKINGSRKDGKSSNGARNRTTTAEYLISQHADAHPRVSSPKQSPRGTDDESPRGDVTKGFPSISRMTLNDDYDEKEKRRRQDDASKTFNEFASSPHGDSGRTSSREKRDGTVGSERREALGAVGGRAYDDRYSSGQYSFSSTFAGQESMLRDLDRVPKDELTEVQKWLDKNDKIGDDETLRLKLMQVKLDTEEERTTGLNSYNSHDSTRTRNETALPNLSHLSVEDRETIEKILDDRRLGTGSSAVGVGMHSLQARGPYFHGERTRDYASGTEGYSNSLANPESTRFSFDLPGRIHVKVFHGNIVKAKTEVIVSAANQELRNIAGVAGAIEKAAGYTLRQECERYVRRNGNLKISDVIHTSPGDLTGLKYVFHAVGPVYVPSLKQRSEKLLTLTFLRCLDHAHSLDVKSLSFPFISTGVFEAPIDVCVESFLNAVVLFSQNNASKTVVQEIHLVNTDLEMVQTAIVMLKQRLEDGYDVLFANAEAFLRSKSNSSGNERSPRPETKQKPVRRTSSLSRDPRPSPRDDTDKWAHKRTEDRPEEKESHESSLKPVPRPRSGSASGRVSSRPQSAGAATSSGSGKKATSASKPDFSKTMSDFRQNNSSSSSYKLKTRPATTSNTSSPRGKPMRATENVLGAEHDPYYSTSETLHHKYSSDREYSSLPSNIETSSGARTLPKPPSSSIDSCPICMEPQLDPFKLDKCGHVFCKSCIRQAFDTKPVCPICGMVYGVLTGDQPSDGKMTYSIQSDLPIPGYRDARGTIVIEYKFPSGTQQDHHPNPGRRYSSLHRTAYLPNNTEGKEVLKLLKKAFQNKLTFTIGESRTTGMAGVLTWNDIHHKTYLTGGATNFGYPDPDYLKRVREELAAKGITS